MKRIIPLVLSLMSNVAFASMMQAEAPTTPQNQNQPATNNANTTQPADKSVVFEEGDPKARGTPAVVVEAPSIKSLLPNPGLKQRPSLAPEAVPVPAPATTQNAPKPIVTPQSADEAEASALRQRYAPNKSANKFKRELAYQMMLDQAVPLSPEQIIQLRKMLDLTEQAAATSPTVPPLPVSSSMMVNLEPGSLPPIVRLAAGFVSSVVFVDSTGAPWPIASYSIGNPNEFNIQWDQISNTLFIQSLQTYSHGNLAVRLADLNTPVMISLVSGQKEIDYRADLQVKGRGPNATAPIVPSSVKNDRTLINLLDGLPPKDSVQLRLIPEVGNAWSKGNTVYLRTQHTLLSPAWTNTVASADGTRVYEMPKAPFVLMSHEGRSITVELKGL